MGNSRVGWVERKWNPTSTFVNYVAFNVFFGSLLAMKTERVTGNLIITAIQ